MKALAVGIVLLAVSFWPLFLMARELVIASAVRSQYSVEILPAWGDHTDGHIQSSIGGHTVQLIDDAPASSDDKARVVGPVRVLVDGRDYSNGADVTIRPAFADSNRYWGYVLLKKLTDQRNGTEHLVVAQNIGRNRYRLLWVGKTGQVLDETFGYEQRCDPPVRADLIDYVVPHPVGYCSDLMTVWPTLVYPLLFPWTTGAVGLVCTVVGLVGRWRGSSSTTRGRSGESRFSASVCLPSCG